MLKRFRAVQLHGTMAPPFVVTVYGLMNGLLFQNWETPELFRCSNKVLTIILELGKFDSLRVPNSVSLGDDEAESARCSDAGTLTRDLD